MPHMSSTDSFIKWYPQNARLNVHSEEATPGCWPSRQSCKEKLYLRLANKRKRLRWAKEHRHWTEEDWKKALWTDESKFGLHRRTFVRRRTSEKMLSVKHGGGNVMVWGCLGAGKVGDLYKLKGILNKEGYHSILQCHAKPCGQRLIGANFLLQQDNDPKHTSKLCNNYLGKKQSAGGSLPEG